MLEFNFSHLAFFFVSMRHSLFPIDLSLCFCIGSKRRRFQDAFRDGRERAKGNCSNGGLFPPTLSLLSPLSSLPFSPLHFELLSLVSVRQTAAIIQGVSVIILRKFCMADF